MVLGVGERPCFQVNCTPLQLNCFLASKPREQQEQQIISDREGLGRRILSQCQHGRVLTPKRVRMRVDLRRAHTWLPAKPGRYEIQLQVNDPAVRTRHLENGYYVRTVEIPVV